MKRVVLIALIGALISVSAPVARAADAPTEITIQNPDQWVSAVRKQLEGDLAGAVGIQLASATGSPADNGFFFAIGALFGVGHGEFTLDTRITPGAGTRLTCESVICFQNGPDSQGPQYLFLTDGANELVSLLPNGSSTTVVDAGPTLRSIALDTVSAALSVAVSYIINKIGFSGTACMQQVKQMTISIAYELVWRVISTVQLLVNGEVNQAVRKLLESIVALPAIMIRSSSVMIGVCVVDMFKKGEWLNAKKWIQERMLKEALSMVLDPFFILDIGASVTSYFLSASSAITNLNKTSRIVITAGASSAIASSAQSESPTSTVAAGSQAPLPALCRLSDFDFALRDYEPGLLDERFAVARCSGWVDFVENNQGLGSIFIINEAHDACLYPDAHTLSVNTFAGDNPSGVLTDDMGFVWWLVWDSSAVLPSLAEFYSRVKLFGSSETVCDPFRPGSPPRGRDPIQVEGLYEYGWDAFEYVFGDVTNPNNVYAVYPLSPFSRDQNQPVMLLLNFTADPSASGGWNLNSIEYLDQIQIP